MHMLLALKLQGVIIYMIARWICWLIQNTR